MKSSMRDPGQPHRYTPLAICSRSETGGESPHKIGQLQAALRVTRNIVWNLLDFSFSGAARCSEWLGLRPDLWAAPAEFCRHNQLPTLPSSLCSKQELRGRAPDNRPIPREPRLH